MKDVLLVAHGNCIPNPGKGGWACVLRWATHSREICGSEPEATNLRMELRAVVEGLKALKQPCRVTVRTRSEYVRDGLASWLERWSASGWMHRVKHQGQQPIKHRDLWEEAYCLKGTHEIRFELIPDGVSDKDHNRCVSMANAAVACDPGNSDLELD